jgi:hypothetical protein
MGSPFDKRALETAILRSGWQGVWEDQLDGLWLKIQFLATKGKYRRLISNIEKDNDRSNFVASAVEVTIAFQFESAGIDLNYEIKQDPNHNSSVDFRWNTASGIAVYIEVRLLQQDKATTGSIEGQLKTGNIWSVAKDGDAEQEDIVRVQQVVLEKVQGRDGTPTKFLVRDQNIVNIVAIDISQIILGTFDQYDCLLVGGGDPSVPAVCRREIFGLFQEARPEYPDRIQTVAKSYAHLKETLHGILFLFRRPKRESFNYSLEHFLVWNPALIDERSAAAISEQVELALPLYKKREQ